MIVSDEANPYSTESSLNDRIVRRLGDEEQALSSILDAVRRLHQSLMNLNGEEMLQSLENESSALVAAQQLQTTRNEFRDEVGKKFGIRADELTLTVLSERVTGPLRETIVQSRKRMMSMATELNRLNRQNGAMLYQSMNLVRDVIGRLTNSAGLGESYTPGGARQNSHVGPLVQWGG